jgi:hypothetical protein
MIAVDLSAAVWRKSNRSTSHANCVEVASVPMWRKSSRSSSEGNCVEIAPVPAWRKSSRSSSEANCVEVAPVDAAMAVRDSKNTTGPALAFPPTAWNLFLASQ